MKNKFHFTKNLMLIVTLFVISAISAEAVETAGSAVNERFKTAIAQKLTEKLRVELSDQNVAVKISTLENRETSPVSLNLEGRALAVVKNDKTELPFEFSARVDAGGRDIEDVTYKFVEAPAEFAPSLAENNLMKELMTQISKDYKTTNIVISIDGFDEQKLATDETKYEGIGEVRIGDLEWTKIKFNVVLDSQQQKAARILYEVQK